MADGSIKVLNLYAGIGGNRKLWTDCEVTAVEMNPEIAKIYQDFFPDDKVIVGDAHQYLLDHYKEFDFIWSSPPCPTHSKMRLTNHGEGARKTKLTYPDAKLYQEITLLQYFSLPKTKWVIENVVSFYSPWILPTTTLDRHYFWTNFKIQQREFDSSEFDVNASKRSAFGVDIASYKIKHRKDQIIRNMVNPELGLHIFNAALERIDNTKVKQIELEL